MHDEVCIPLHIGNNSVAYLVGREVDNRGNRTSILKMTLDTSTISIVNVSCFDHCDGCNETIMVVVIGEFEVGITKRPMGLQTF